MVEGGYRRSKIGPASYVFGVLAAPVAQTCSLLYRRFLTCPMSPASNALPITNRRYGRLKICATLSRYDGGEGMALVLMCASDFGFRISDVGCIVTGPRRA